MEELSQQQTQESEMPLGQKLETVPSYQLSVSETQQSIVMYRALHATRGALGKCDITMKVLQPMMRKLSGENRHEQLQGGEEGAPR